MEFSIVAQTQIFLYAIVLGFAMGGVYDTGRCMRALGGNKWLLTALLDVFYCVVWMLALVAFTLVHGDGSLRSYIMLGCAGGMTLYFLTVSRVVVRFLLPRLRRLHRWWTEMRARRKRKKEISPDVPKDN
ncbi:MAG: hypothetical protein EOM69_03640 [Clostridia bacterium]|nr:hypothetical protein [Clostridia bacterium]